MGVERMYTVKEAATRFHVTENTILIWIKEGRLKATKIGRKWLFTEDMLQELIERGQQQPHTGADENSQDAKTLPETASM